MRFNPWRFASGRSGQEYKPRVYLDGSITDNAQLNVATLQEAFDHPDNLSFKMREVHIKSLNMPGHIIYVEGAAKADTIEKHVVRPLIEYDCSNNSEAEPLVLLKQHVLTSLSVKQVTQFQDIVDELLSGNTALFVDGTSQAIIVDTRGFEYREVSTPTIEQTLRGPKEAFIESAEVNRSLVRKYLKDNELQCEIVRFGVNKSKQVFLMYLRNIANRQIIERVTKRIEQIETETVQNLYILEQYIEERPYSPIPTVFLTERPDRVVSFLQEGHVAVIMDNSPVALIAPATFWTFFHTAEDQYNRWATGNFIRIIRMIAIFATMFVPGIYIAISTYHVEMLPTDLMLAIAAARERVPFPVIAEILFMEISFELLRESGIRVPAAIGSTIGIVGALVLGQASVEANLVSPILVIIVAVTGLASFIIPDISLNFVVRLQRFIFIIFAAFLGFFGIALYLTYMISYLVTIKSFGVPYMAPMAPNLPSSKDLFLRKLAWKQWIRPGSMRPKDQAKQDKPEGN